MDLSEVDEKQIRCYRVDRYVIELSKSLSKGIKQYLANEKQRPINEITKHDIANELFDVILAEIDWNLKYKLPEGTSLEFHVTPKGTDKAKEEARAH
jgi:hypothetical protein